MKTNGALLNLVRTVKGYSLEQLSTISGLSKGLLSRYESGSRPLSDDRFSELCRQMDVEEKLVEILLSQGINPRNSELAQQLGILLLTELEEARNANKQDK